jgi:hypothetical protein
MEAAAVDADSVLAGAIFNSLAALPEKKDVCVGATRFGCTGMVRPCDGSSGPPFQLVCHTCFCVSWGGSHFTGKGLP